MSYDFLGEINKILDCERFDKDDFKISITPEEVNIKYIYSDRGYSFRINIPDSKEEVEDKRSVSFGLHKNTKWVYVFSGAMIPGKYSNMESFKYHGFDNVKNEINSWCGYLYEELKKVSSNKTNDNDSEYEKYKSQFEAIEKVIDERIDDNEMFSLEDKEQFNNKLNEIKNEFEEHLKKIISEQETLKVELKKVNDDFSKLKDSLNYMSKKNWGKKFVRKATEIFKDANKRKIAITLLKGTNILLRKYDIDIPLLDEGIEVINEVSESK